MRDAQLEALIDHAGRERVFAIVRAAGWNPQDRVPRFVWQEAAMIAMRRRSATAQAAREQSEGNT